MSAIDAGRPTGRPHRLPARTLALFGRPRLALGGSGGHRPRCPPPDSIRVFSLSGWSCRLEAARNYVAFGIFRCVRFRRPAGPGFRQFGSTCSPNCLTDRIGPL